MFERLKHVLSIISATMIDRPFLTPKLSRWYLTKIFYGNFILSLKVLPCQMKSEGNLFPHFSDDGKISAKSIWPVECSFRQQLRTQQPRQPLSSLPHLHYSSAGLRDSIRCRHERKHPVRCRIQTREESGYEVYQYPNNRTRPSRHMICRRRCQRGTDNLGDASESYLLRM